jgi:hypothetical protein
VDNPAPNGNLWTIWLRQGRLTSRSEYLRDEKAAGGCGPLSWIRRRWCAQPKQWEGPWVELTPPCRRPANSTGMAAIDSTGVAATPGLPQSMFHVKRASPAGVVAVGVAGTDLCLLPPDPAESRGRPPTALGSPMPARTS